MEEAYAKIDKDKVESTILGIDASITAWINQERSKSNAYLRKKSLGDSQSNRAHYRWLRKPRLDTGSYGKPGEKVYFYDKIANYDLVIALVPIFLVLVLLLNFIA